MRRRILFVLSLGSLFIPTMAWGQQSSSGAGQTASLLPTIYAAQIPGNALKDITLSGTATLYGSQTQQSGTVTLKAAYNGKSSIEFQSSSGAQSDRRTILPLARQGTWTGPDGAVHNVISQNLTGPHPAWFFPGLIVTSGLASPLYCTSDLGQETRNGASVEHIAIWQTPIASLPVSAYASNQQQTQYDVYVDPASFLPTAITFSVYPDPANPNQFLVPSPGSTTSVVEEIRYSNYQSIQGIPVAHHVQIYFQSVLFFDIQVGTVNINTGFDTPGN
jgi:hypothetical protein